MAEQDKLRDKFGGCAPYRLKSTMGATEPMLSIVLDDLGEGNPERTRAAVDLGQKHALTYAFIPVAGREEFIKEQVVEAFVNADEVIMHTPMSTGNASVDKVDPNYPRLMTTDSSKIIEQKLAMDFKVFDGFSHMVIGANNHQGSQFTQDYKGMVTALTEMKEAGMQFFLDSKTIANTSVCKAGAAVGMPVVSRDIFLDHNNNERDIKAQLLKAVDKAVENGSAIAIGHHYTDTTLKVLGEMLPELEKNYGVKLVTLSDVVEHRLGIEISPTNLSR